MKVLHIAGGYSTQELYSRLVTKLRSIGMIQFVYVPVRNKKEIDSYNLNHLSGIVIKYSFILRKYHRLLFNRKIMHLHSDLKKFVDIEKMQIVHAHSLFSDGAVALKLKIEYGIPYFVAIRNTDLNIFFKFMIHLRSHGLKIMQHADGIIFLSPAYINPVLNRFVPQTMRSEISKKISIIPNGVNDFWIEHSCFEPKVCKNNVKIIYVGDFSRNKNVLSVIKAVEELNTKYGNITLTLVGGGGKGSKMVMRKIEKSSPDVIKYHERTNDKQKLLKYYQESDIFVMASFKESFGIVYLEAMSQGLPIIYTKGQGIDGYFTEDIPGLAVDPNNIEDIKNNILFIKEHLTEMSQNALIHIKKFNWSLIALKYKKLYENIDTEKNL